MTRNILILRIHQKSFFVHKDDTDVPTRIEEDIGNGLLKSFGNYRIVKAEADALLHGGDDVYGGNDNKPWMELKHHKNLYVVPYVLYESDQFPDGIRAAVHVGRVEDVQLDNKTGNVLFLLHNWKETFTSILGESIAISPFADAIFNKDGNLKHTDVTNSSFCKIQLSKLDRDNLSYVSCIRCLAIMKTYAENFHVCQRCNFISREYFRFNFKCDSNLCEWIYKSEAFKKLETFHGVTRCKECGHNVSIYIRD